MMLSDTQVRRLAKRQTCPRCNTEKTQGHALCRRCRMKLPAHMRRPLEQIAAKDGSLVGKALRAAANYFDVHFRSIRHFGGGRVR